MKPFAAVVLLVFVAMAFLGVFIFATFTNKNAASIGTVKIWGSIPAGVIDTLIGEIRDAREDFKSVTYRVLPEDILMPELVAAIAAGTGPDVVLFPASSFVKDGNKLQPIPYADVSRRSFQDAFIEAGEVFLTPDGIAALPFVVDPLVLYWNRTLFSDAGLAAPPRFWDEVAVVAPRLTKRSPNGSLTQSAIALGGWENVAHAKGILITLMHQLGSPVVETDRDGNYQSVLTKQKKSGIDVADSAIRFYTSFADPIKPVYSWNRSQKNSRDAFLGGTVALYIAPASELLGLRAGNPNLNFDVASVPSARGESSSVYATLTGLAIPRGAKNASGASQVIALLASPASSTFLSTAMHLPSVRRDVNVDSSADQFFALFRASALQSFTFLDPDSVRSDVLFGQMIERVASGRATVSESVRTAHDDLEQLIRVR